MFYLLIFNLPQHTSHKKKHTRGSPHTKNTWRIKDNAVATAYGILFTHK